MSSQSISSMRFDPPHHRNSFGSRFIVTKQHGPLSNMRSKFHKEAGFVNLAFIEFLTVMLGICLLVIIVSGSWPARIIVCAVVGGLCAWVYWLVRWIRFRPGDRVLVKFGPHQGSQGTVIEPLHRGHGARIALDGEDRTGAVDFHFGYDLQKLRSKRVAEPGRSSKRSGEGTGGG